jgi:tetratricopeptide (TPR) repeat protein
MHKNWIRAGFALLLLLVVGVSAVEAAREASVGGTVVDENGEKLQGVLVTVFSAEETRTATTSKKGRFRLIVMDATQQFSLRLEKEGFITQEGPIRVRVGEASNQTYTMTSGETAAAMQGAAESVAAYNAGAEAFNAGDYAAARTKFEEALAHEPGMIAAQKVLTLVYFQLRELPLAIASAEVVVAAEPENEAALKIGFDAASSLGDAEKAVFFLDRLAEVKRDSDTAARVFNFGVAEMRAGAIDEAKRRFTQALEIDPTLGAAYNGLAQLHLQSDEFDEALEIADRLLELDPGNAEALGIRYEAYRRTGDEEQMNAALEQLQSADPDRIVEAFFQQGVLMFNEGNAEAAVEAFERVLSADPQHSRAYYELGRAYLSAGDMDKAKQALQTFLEMAPNDPEAPSAQEMLGYLD